MAEKTHGAPPASRLGFAVTAVTLAGCVIALLGAAEIRARPLLMGFVADCGTLQSTSPEQRLLQAHGDRNGNGYGYLRDATAGLPEPDLLPVTRYANHGRNVEYLLPGRWRVDGRVLVGIDLPDDATRERVVATAVRVAWNVPHDARLRTWAFRTGDDCDALTGFRVRPGPRATGVRQLELRLVDRPQRPVVLGTWSVPLGPGPVVAFSLPCPIEPFSIARGATDFLVETDAGAPADLAGIEILGVKVRLRGHTIVHRENRCFTAVSNAFLDRIEKDPLPAWKGWLDSLRGASPGRLPAAPIAAAPGGAGRVAGALFALLLLPLAAGGWPRMRGETLAARWWVGMGLVATVVTVGYMARVPQGVVALALGLLCAWGTAAALRRIVRVCRSGRARAPAAGERSAPGVGIARAAIAMLWIAACTAVVAHPVAAWDALAIWYPKVRWIVEWRPTGTLPGASYHDYPILGPSFEAVIVRLSGDECFGRLLFPTVYAMWGLCLLGPRRRNALRIAPWTVALVLWAAFDLFTFTSGNQDALLMTCSGMAALCFCRALTAPGHGPAGTGFLFCALLPLIKAEGAVIAALLATAFSATLVWNRPHDDRGRCLLRLVPRLGLLGLAIALWPVLLAVNGVDFRAIQGDAFSWAAFVRMGDHLDRLGPVLRHLGGQGATQGCLVVVCVLASVAAFVRARSRRVVLAFLGLVGAGHLARVTAAFLTTQRDLAWHLATAGQRLLMQGLFVPQLMLVLTMTALAESRPLESAASGPGGSLREQDGQSDLAPRGEPAAPS